MKIKKRILFISIASIFFVIILIGVIYYFKQKINYAQNIYSNVTQTIKIIRGSTGFPTITAETIEDAYFAIGYTHTQDHYLLMEYYRTIAISTNTAINADDAERLEKIIRAAGIQSKALEISSAIKEPYISYLKAFVNGINTARQHQINISSIEKEWEVVDVIAILLMREWCDSFLNNRELFFPILDNKTDKLYSMIIPENFTFSYTENEKKGIEYIRSMRRLVERYVGTFNRGFVLAIENKDGTSKPPVKAVSCETLSNSYPNWYPVKININQQEIKAITNIGLPFLLSGENGKISFTGFSSAVSSQNFFVETTHKSGSTVQYRSGGVLQNFNPEREPDLSDSHKIKTNLVFKTDIGPVINDIFEDSEYPSKIFTMQSILPTEKYITSLFNIPFCDTIEQAIASLRTSDCLPKTFILGNNLKTSKFYCGVVPKQNNTGKVFLKPFDFSKELTNISLLPQRYYNSNIAGTTYFDDANDFLKRNSIYETVRFERLNQLLKDFYNADFNLQIDDILTDDYSLFAQNLAPYFTSLLHTNPITSAKLSRVYFKDWDYKYSIDKVPPTIFEALMRNYIDEIIADKFSEIKPLNKTDYSLLMESLSKVLLIQTPKTFREDTQTFSDELKGAIFDRAFLKSLRELNTLKGPIMHEWVWGDLHKRHFRTRIESSSFITRLLYPYEAMSSVGGSGTVISSTSGRDYRLAKETSLYGTIGLSNSELTANYTSSTNPFSKFYFGKLETPSVKIFEKEEPLYTTTIMPLKK